MYQLVSCFPSLSLANRLLTEQELKVGMAELATVEVDHTNTAAAEPDGITAAAEDAGGSDGEPELAGHIFIYVQQVGSET